MTAWFTPRLIPGIVRRESAASFSHRILPFTSRRRSAIMPAMADAKNEIQSLRDQIDEHDRRYHDFARPIISDREYDRLIDRLKQLETNHPELAAPDSPTQRVGGKPIEGFVHVTHAQPMLSIDNTYNENELREFDGRVARGLEGEPYTYVVDPKIDGVAISLRYEKSLLVFAATRGDGKVGDDVTHTIRTVKPIPLRLRGSDVPDVVEIRGEIYWPRDAFDAYNRKRESAGQPVFANPRNATTGTLKQLDASKVAGRGLSFIAHGFGQVSPVKWKSFSALLGAFKNWGVPIGEIAIAETIDEVIARVTDWDGKRHDLPYETDGMVIKVDSLHHREVLGETSKYPRWCIAYKFAAEQAESKIKRVDFQVGKSGTITPRAVLDPVQLSGTTVSHASLHNFDQVDRLDVRIGDTVIVQKAGEIIPQVVRVVTKDSPGRGERIVPPTKCPVCEGAVGKDEGGVYVRCVNPMCPAQLKERLIHFCGRNQMDIEILGEVVVEKLVDKGWLTSYADIYTLPEQRDELAEMYFEYERENAGEIKKVSVRYGEKRADKLVEGVEKSKRRPLSRVLAALNIRHVGGSSAELLAEHFGTMKKLSEASEEALQEVDGVGPEMAKSVRVFFDSEAGRSTWEALREAGVNMKQPTRASGGDGLLAGKTIVVTGTLERLGRKEIESIIKELGGKTTGSVSKKTDFVVAGDKAGSKLDKANKLSVEVIDETTFLKRIGRD